VSACGKADELSRFNGDAAQKEASAVRWLLK
jgi:hypothetical protein